MEKTETIGVCPQCGTEFVKTRANKQCCSHRCAAILADRAAKARKREEIAERGSDCPYNDALICKEPKCDTCGWNPLVAKRRLATL